MLSFLWPGKENRQLAQAIKIISKGGRYEVSPSIIETMYGAVQTTLQKGPQFDLTVRRNVVESYRSLYELRHVLDEVNDLMAAGEMPSKNYNHHQEIRKETLDYWLVDANNHRVDYSDFIRDLCAVVSKHLQLLYEMEATQKKVYYQTLTTSLYTVHCDLLTLAEVHLRHYSQR